MTIDVSSAATNPSHGDYFRIGVMSTQQHHAQVLQCLANLKQWAGRTKGMSAVISICQIMKGIQAIGLDEDFVRTLLRIQRAALG